MDSNKKNEDSNRCKRIFEMLPILLTQKKHQLFLNENLIMKNKMNTYELILNI